MLPKNSSDVAMFGMNCMASAMQFLNIDYVTMEANQEEYVIYRKAKVPAVLLPLSPPEALAAPRPLSFRCEICTCEFEASPQGFVKCPSCGSRDLEVKS